VPLLGPLDPFRALTTLRSDAARVARAVQPDHTTLNERSLRTYSGVMTHAFLHAAVAPSRRVRPCATDDLVERGAALAADLGLPPVPYLAGANSQRFIEGDDTGSEARSLFVTRSAVLEMLWALEQLPTEDGGWAVRAVDACSQLARFVALVRGDDYGRLLRGSRRMRVFDPRVDWTLGITATTAGDAGQRGWRDIIVIGPQPDRASGHVFGFMPPHGYGAQRLHNVKRKLGPDRIVRVMLEEWLRANGYIRASGAVDRTVDAAMACGRT